VDANQLALFTQIFQALITKRARTACNQGIYDNRIVDSKAFCFVVIFYDSPCEFVTHDQWRDSDATLAKKTGQLTTANTYRINPNQHFSFRRLRFRDIPQRHLAGANPHYCLHIVPSY
jgi:hypothetical protein